MFFNDLNLILPEIYISIAIQILLIAGVMFKSSMERQESITWLSILTLFISTILVLNNSLEAAVVFNGSLIINNLTSIVKVFVLLSTLIILFISFDYFKSEKLENYEYSLLILFAVLGMLLLVSSYDLLTFYIAIELQSLSLYVLASFKRNSELSTEAGLKYFILGALSSGILLFGASLIYGLTGATNFETIGHLLVLDYSLGILTGIVFIAISLLFKLAAAPFHMWAPDVYEGAPTIVTAFFAIVPKIAILGLFIQLFIESLHGWEQIIVISSVISMIIGSVGALGQVKLKRLLAYSSIGNVGYMLIGISTQGIESLMVYIIVYMIMSINIFTILLSLRNSKNNDLISYITDLAGLSKENALLAITFALALLSVAGIPPLAGFFSKLYLFLGAMETSMYALAIIGVLTSVIATVYYIRLIKIMYFDNTSNAITYETIDIQKSLVLGITFLFIIFFLANPSFILLLAHQISYSLSI